MRVKKTLSSKHFIVELLAGCYRSISNDGFERASVTLENLLRRKAHVIMVIQNEWHIAFYVSWAEEVP